MYLHSILIVLLCVFTVNQKGDTISVYEIEEDDKAKDWVHFRSKKLEFKTFQAHAVYYETQADM